MWLSIPLPALLRRSPRYLSPPLRRHRISPRLASLLAHGDRSRVLTLFLWRGIAVRLLPRSNVDYRLGELVGVPRAFGGLVCHVGHIALGPARNKSVWLPQSN